MSIILGVFYTLQLIAEVDAYMGESSASVDPVNLLSKARMGDMITHLKTEFDTVILDCPPSGPISDAKSSPGLRTGF